MAEKKAVVLTNGTQSQVPDADTLLVGQAVAFPVTDMVKDKRRVLARRRPHGATYLLQIKCKRHSRAREAHDFNPWNVKAFAE